MASSHEGHPQIDTTAPFGVEYFTNLDTIEIKADKLSLGGLSCIRGDGSGPADAISPHPSADTGETKPGNPGDPLPDPRPPRADVTSLF